ncbi:MAG TPA: hypothetical protein VEV15_01585, partial [Flavisolibacter sp.]|nr:hypothetical protein [Flavisolibacter sp.]
SFSLFVPGVSLLQRSAWLPVFHFFVGLQAVQSGGILWFIKAVGPGPAGVCTGGIIHIGMIQIIWLCRGARVITGQQNSK